MENEIIKTQGLEKSFSVGKEKVFALENVDLSIKRGEFVVIYGPSGSGKTTLLSLLAGLDKPTKGEIIVDGENINDLHSKEIAKYRGTKIGMVFQQFNLVQTLNALDNVAMPLILDGVAGRQARRKASKILSELNMSDRAKHRPNQLSGGQQQRIAIARALVADPEILLVDEPTGNLDVQTGKEIIDLLKQINKKLGRTIILVTHNPDFIDSGDRVIYTEDGRVTHETASKNSATTEKVAETKTPVKKHGKLNIFETLKIAKNHFVSKGLRTFLTTLGVALGVASIVILVSLGIGLQTITSNQLASLDMLVSINVTANKDSLNKLDDQVVQRISNINNISLVSPTITSQAKMSYENSTAQVIFTGAKPEAIDFEGISAENGKNYTEDSGILLSKAAAKNFDPDHPEYLIDKTVVVDLVITPENGDLTKAKIVTLEDKVTGITSDESTPSAFASLNRVKKLTGITTYNTLKVKVNDRKNVETAKNKIEEMGFSTSSVVDLIKKVDKVFLVAQIVLGLIGSVALIVALIGIVNIMTVALLERTHEVGILKAIGATDRDIKRIFIYEVLFFGLFGSIAGVLLAWGFGETINCAISAIMKASDIPGSLRLFEVPRTFAIEMILLTIFISLLGGWYPSKRASKLSPMDALRYE